MTSQVSKLLDSIQRPCLYDVYNRGYEKSYTNVFDLHFQGQTSRSSDWFWVSEILDIVNVRIDTKIKYVACIQPELRKVI